MVSRYSSLSEVRDQTWVRPPAETGLIRNPAVMRVCSTVPPDDVTVTRQVVVEVPFTVVTVGVTVIFALGGKTMSVPVIVQFVIRAYSVSGLVALAWKPVRTWTRIGVATSTEPMVVPW